MDILPVLTAIATGVFTGGLAWLSYLLADRRANHFERTSFHTPSKFILMLAVMSSVMTLGAIIGGTSVSFALIWAAAHSVAISTIDVIRNRRSNKLHVDRNAPMITADQYPQAHVSPWPPRRDRDEHKAYEE